MEQWYPSQQIVRDKAPVDLELYGSKIQNRMEKKVQQLYLQKLACEHI
jgi:hypothetical protein